MSTRDETGEHGQGPVSALGNSGSANSYLPRGSEQSREEIARVIVSEAFHRCQPNRGDVFGWLDDHALEFADAILALSTAHAEGLGKGDEYGVQTHVEPQHCTGWRTIDSAPREGQHFLACRAGSSFGWYDGKQAPPIQTVVHYWSNPGEEGFYTSVNELEPQHPFDATHWKPLDEPVIECPDCPNYIGKCPTCHRRRPRPAALSSAKPLSRVGQGANAYTAEGKDALDTTSILQARQRELETERDEALKARRALITAFHAEADKREAAETRQRELEEALRPFAEAHDNRPDINDAHPDYDKGDIWESPCAMSITYGDLRKAAALLSPPTLEA